MGTNALLRDGGEINIQQSNGRSVSSLRQGPLCGASLDHLVGAHEQGDNRPQGIAHYGCRPNMTFRMQASRWRTKGSSFRDFCAVLLYVSRSSLLQYCFSLNQHFLSPSSAADTHRDSTPT